LQFLKRVCSIILDPQMLNGLNWSHTLDDVFKQNYVEDPSLSWQYFGSTFGFMRVFPGFRYVARSSYHVFPLISPDERMMMTKE